MSTMSIPLCLSNTSSTLGQHPVLHKTHLIPPLKFRNFSRTPVKNPSFIEFCNQGNLKEVFHSLASFSTHHDSLSSSPDDLYAPLLEHCAMQSGLTQGRQVHARMIKSNVVSDSVFLSTKLVLMYGKCRSLSDAVKVFDKMWGRTIFTWNAMIGAYVGNGQPLRAIETYQEMRVSGVPLDACTFPCVLKAAGMLKDIWCGAEIHGLVIKRGYDSNLFIVNSLVAMYAKCNDLKGARQLFHRLKDKEDIVSWNSIISAYSVNRQCIEALGLFREMLEAGLPVNTYTLVAALQACEDSSFRKLGMEIHAAILKSSYNGDVYVANALVAMYVRCGSMDEAAGIFDRLSDKDIVSWNSMLTCFFQNGLYGEVLKFFHDLQDSGQKPDQVSVVNVAGASGRLGYLLNGMEIHAYAIKKGFDSELQVGNTIVDMYAKCCHVKYMGRAFDKMPAKDLISWTTVIAGYAQNKCCVEALEMLWKVQMEGVEVDTMMIGSILMACNGLKCMSHVKEIHGYIMRRGLSDLMLQNTIVDVYGEGGNIDYAMRMFEGIECKDVVSWTNMISSFDHNGLASEALQLFYHMVETNVESDSVTLLSILSAAASLSALKKGKEIHGFIIRKGFMSEGSILNSLVDMYARCGTLDQAYKVFNGVKDKSLVLWTSMINGYGMHGRGKPAIDLFRRMEVEKLVPDHITFLSLLHACSHSGLVIEGRKFFETMKCEYRLDPWSEHYACLVDLLGRANRLEEAYQFVKGMQVEPTAEVWCALLGACHVHSNTELGDIVAQKLLEMNLENPGNYVLVSNVFAASGRWKDVEKVRKRMKGSGLKKNPGCSWIEVGNSVHTFTARDKCHPDSDKIYKKLVLITEKLEREGDYVAQTKFVLHNVEEEEKVQMLYGHSERLAIAYGLLRIPEGTPIRVTKNLRVCGDCHIFCKLVSKFFERELVIRDSNRFHHFKEGVCSCGDFW